MRNVVVITMINFNKTYLFLAFFFLVMGGCKNKQPGNADFYFTLMHANETNIYFNNKITESDSVNVFENEYMYNGSGVGIGDFNNDGLQDIFFGGSMVSSRLYINKGNFRFEDITGKSGIQTSRWCTGVSVVDINNDGFQDIYVSSSHTRDANKRENLLFINDGKLHFSEQAYQYGLADTGFSTQAAFFDYDKDGDLDMYLLNHKLYSRDANNLMPKDTSGKSLAQDRLYRNNGVVAGTSHPTFTDVSIEAGVKEDGYGLGIVITDVNNDNWPDVYVANDYIGNDLLWLNNKNGSFSNIIATALKHQSYNSMGVDAADINNDALPDLAVLDMMPEGNDRKKMMFNAASQEKYDMALRLGYEPAFVRNMLHLHNGIKDNIGEKTPFYSEIGQLAGISETDWSWSILVADFDNDCWKDIHITNGLTKDVTNNDYAAFRNEQIENNYSFGNENLKNPLDKETIALLRKQLDKYEGIKINNYFFHNNGNFTFTNTTVSIGLGTPSVSNGAAYADLDNDGDLDLVVNNMNQEAFIWRNETRGSINDTAQNFFTIQLEGPGSNRFGLGTKVTLFNKDDVQFFEQAPVRGFSSSVDYRLHFGLGNVALIDSMKILWPDDKEQVIRNVKANQQLTVKHSNAKITVESKRQNTNRVFNNVTQESGIDFKHQETDYFDFGNRRSLPQRYSQLGPDIATGDMNADGLIDFFVGGAVNQPGKLFFQKQDGNFITKNLITGNKPGEDLSSVLFDADGDTDLDLLIIGGSPEIGGVQYNQPRLYNNDGKGNFALNAEAFPKGIDDITKQVAVSDYDGDGDIDVFIGGRLVPLKYPQSPRSYILQNNAGKFKDVTKEVGPSLEFAGMITGAVFTDFNNDNRPDLVICGEWMPLRFFVNKAGKFEEITKSTGLTKMSGQWRSLQAADLDKDGDMDFVAGNLGLNNKFNITPERPLKLYAGDFDGNNSIDLIPAYHMKDNDGHFQLFPALDRMQLADQIPLIKKKFLLSSEYALITMKDLLKSLGTRNIVEKECEITSTVWIENLGNGKFRHHLLPIEAQFAPVNAIVADDIDNDGAVDLILGGNEYGTEFSTGRYDASYGLILKGDGKGSFTPLDAASTGFVLDGDVRSIRLLKAKSKLNVLIGFNNEKLRCFQVQNGVVNDLRNTNSESVEK